MAQTTLSGTITVHAGTKRSSSATVELHNSAGDVVDQSRVDDDGRFLFHLAPGRWSLVVWDEHGHRGKGEATLEEGEHKVLDLDLSEPEGGH